MVGGGRRRPYPHRLAWIRQRIWSRQCGAKLRGSSSESDGNPKPVVEPVVRDDDVASKHAMKLGDGSGDRTCSPKLGSGVPDVSPKRAVEVGGGGAGAGCGPNMGTCDRDGSPKRVVAVEDGSDSTCALNLGHDDGIEQVKHGRNVRGRRIGRGRLRVDCNGQLYVLDSEAEDSAVEESCRPEVHRRRGARGRRVAATGEVALEVDTIKATAVADDGLTPEIVQCMELFLTGMEEANREVLVSMVKVAFTSFYKPY